MSELFVTITLALFVIFGCLIYRYGLKQIFGELARTIGRVCEILMWGRDGQPEPPDKIDRLQELYVEGHLSDEGFERMIEQTLKEDDDDE